MNNQTPYKFIDISTEQYRNYVFSTPHGLVTIHIANPDKLHVSSSGGHRLLDVDGVSHYIPSGWLKLEWKAKPGAPNFVA